MDKVQGLNPEPRNSRNVIISVQLINVVFDRLGWGL